MQAGMRGRISSACVASVPSPQRFSRVIAALGSVAVSMQQSFALAGPELPIPASPNSIDQPPRPRVIPASTAQQPPLDIELRADTQGFDQQLNRFVASGRVMAFVAGGRLLADRLEYEFTTRTIYASGSVRFQRGEQYLQASKLRYSLIASTGELEDVYGVLDLDTTASDLDLAQPPSAALAPLSYWNAPSPLASSQPQFSTEPPALLIQAKGKAQGQAISSWATSTERTQTALEQQPLDPPTQGVEPFKALSSATQLIPSGVAPIEPSNADWRMPPVALSPAAQTMACPPPLPAIPDWHPYPWAATLWGGQMVDSNFGDTFVFNGRLRPEYLLGVGLNKRLIEAGPLALEFDSNLMGHHAYTQAGGEFNQAVPFADTPAQTFAEITAGLGLRLWVQPWLSLGFVEGVSLNTSVSNYEKTYRENYTAFLNYLGFEVEALVSPEWSVVGRIHHRSGAYGTYSGVSEGSNAYLMGVRYRFGEAPAQRLTASMPPPSGCSDPDRTRRQPVRPLAEQLNSVAFGPLDPTTPQEPRTAAKPTTTLTPRQQEQERQQAIDAAVDQRVSNLTYVRSLKLERRLGVTTTYAQPSEAETFGQSQPQQIRSLNAAGPQKLVDGTVSRWRFQAAKLTLTPDGWNGDRVAFTNDPYTPAQSWLDAEGVLAKQLPGGATQIRSQRSRLILENRLPLPMRRNLLLEKDKEVDNPWVTAVDGEDRDGFYVGRKLQPIKLGQRGAKLTLQPQFMVQRALSGTTDSYPLPGQSAGDPGSSQPTRIGDLFGLESKLKGTVLGFSSDATVSISSFDPSNLTNAIRSWGDFAKPISLPGIGTVTSRLFGAYRYRTWNGSLGEQDVYSALGASLEQVGALPNWGSISHNYFWRAGFGSFQGNEFNTTNIADFWRASFFGSVNSSVALWTGKPAPVNAEAATRNTPTPIVPGLSINTNTSLNVAYYGDGTNQNLLSISGGPTLTLGHFTKNFLDYTVFTVTGGGTLRQGQSPFSFDRAVDLATLGLGWTQQLVGPLVFSGGLGLNVDPSSIYFGDVTGASVELRWQRRGYEFAVYYSPYEQIGGVRVKLNDFNFSGTGVPFVPYHPSNEYAKRRSLF